MRSRADIAAEKRIARVRTFDSFCDELRVTAEERARLAFRLAELRYTATLKACLRRARAALSDSPKEGPE